MTSILSIILVVGIAATAMSTQQHPTQLDQTTEEPSSISYSLPTEEPEDLSNLLEIRVEPNIIEDGVTKTMSVLCQLGFWPTSKEPFGLELKKQDPRETHGEPLWIGFAAVYNNEDHVYYSVNMVDTGGATGILNSQSESFLKVTWKHQIQSHYGVYQCQLRFGNRQTSSKDREILTQETTAGFPTSELENIYQELKSAASDTAEEPMSNSNSLPTDELGNMSNENPLEIRADPKIIEYRVTKKLSVTCTIPFWPKSKGPQYLALRRWYSQEPRNNRKTLAILYNNGVMADESLRNGDDVGNGTATGSLNSTSESFLTVTWEHPLPSQRGVYQCFSEGFVSPEETVGFLVSNWTDILQEPKSRTARNTAVAHTTQEPEIIPYSLSTEEPEDLSNLLEIRVEPTIIEDGVTKTMSVLCQLGFWPTSKEPFSLELKKKDPRETHGEPRWIGIASVQRREDRHVTKYAMWGKGWVAGILSSQRESFLNVTWKHPIQSYYGVYQCQLRFGNRETPSEDREILTQETTAGFPTSEMENIYQELKSAVSDTAEEPTSYSNSPLGIRTDPKIIEYRVTEKLSVTCNTSFWPTSKNLLYLALSRWYPQETSENRKTLAIVFDDGDINDDGLRYGIDIGNGTATGSVNGPSESFLTVTWQHPLPSQRGVYQCYALFKKPGSVSRDIMTYGPEETVGFLVSNWTDILQEPTSRTAPNTAAANTTQEPEIIP